MKGISFGLIFGSVLAVALVAFLARPADADVRHVILLHGWGGSGDQWDDARKEYEKAGFTVHALTLPRGGFLPGDTWVNADFVESYIEEHDLKDVQLDGHSLGGTLVFELIRVRRNEAVVSAVTRDSNIHTWPNFGFVCWFIPDQCMNLVRFFILFAPQADVPVLQMSARPQSLPDTDCSLVMDKRHSEFLHDAAATRAAVLWAQGKDPCAMAGPTPTPVPDDCRWWKWLLGWCR